MNHVTYHHYGATILDTPIAQLRRKMDAIVNASLALSRTTARASTVLEENDCAAGTHTLTYRSIVCAPELAEYVVTWSLACVTDAPHTTFVEWMREYRPGTAAGHDQIRPFVSALIDQDRAIATRFAAEYGSSEVVYIDYTLGEPQHLDGPQS